MGYSFPLNAPIGAAASVPNAIAGTSVEYMGDDVMLDVYAAARIVGMSWSLQGFHGSSPGEVFIPNGSTLGLESTVGKLKTNEDFVASLSIPAGTRLVLGITNPGAASSADFLFVVH